MTQDTFIFKQGFFMQKEDDIVTFETYYNFMLAEIIRGKLEANGIPCFIADDGMSGINPIFNERLGIRIKVFARDVERCKEIVGEESNLPPDQDVTPEG